MIVYRILQLNEVEVFRELRLKSLQNAADSMGDLYRDEVDRTLVYHMIMLRDNFVMGLYVDNVLCGVTLASRYGGGNKPKIAHKCISWGTYIDINKVVNQSGYNRVTDRNLGVGLMQAMLDYLKSQGITIINAAIVATNIVSIKMCENTGFIVTHIERNGMLDPVNKCYVDLAMVTAYLT